MPTLIIDRREVTVSRGARLLDAAEALGIAIPTLCCSRDLPHFTSCMLCVVRDVKADRLLPACSAPARDGMAVETDSPPVIEARRMALELLLSEHVGDCEGPCRRICPAAMNIPLMIRQIRAGQLRDAVVTVKRDIVLPAILGRICPAPCERGCRRGAVDAPLSICLLKRGVADADLARADPWMPGVPPETGRRIAVIGAGPAGLAAAAHLRLLGHGCAVYDLHEHPGGTLRTAVPEDRLPRSVIDAEVDWIRNLGVAFRMRTHIGRDVSLAELRKDHAAIVVATGTLDPAGARDLFEADVTHRGLRVDPHTCRTSVPDLFAGGAAIGDCKMAVRALANGKAMAVSVDQYLRGLPVTGPKDRFSSIIGKLLDGEAAGFLAEATGDARVEPRVPRDGLSADEAARESGRCLHCDCRKAETCRLRDFSDTYRAHAGHFKGAERDRFEQIRQHAEVIYEPGKCIKCGLCIRLTEREREPLGLTFIGRGFSVRVAVPFNETLSAGLTKTAAACVRICPTGALAFPRGDALDPRPERDG